MRSEQHRMNVASLPCIACGIENHSQCAHSNSHVFGKGFGIKASDLASFPLCCTRPGEVGCHYRHDNYVGMTREEAAAKEPIYIMDTLAKLIQAGKLKVCK